jgi:TM2 domain-containing membrane protein YozV
LRITGYGRELYFILLRTEQKSKGEPVMNSVPYSSPEAIFYQQYEAVRRDEVVGILLALFLGGFGVHHFYLHKTGLGILYIIFCWTPIPWILGFIECFFMPGRVRVFNATQAAGIAAMLGISIPTWSHPVNITVNVPYTTQPGTLAACKNCQRANPPGARFCSGCGAALELPSEVWNANIQ